MQKWKLIALDLDGTTLSPDGTITEHTREWLKRAQNAGIPVTFATGRHWNGLVEELATELAIDVPVVTTNGAEVHLPDGKLVARHYLPTESVAALLQIAREKDTHYWGATVEGAIQKADITDNVQAHEWLKFGFYAEEAEVIAAIWRHLDELGRFSLSNSHPLNIEVNAEGVTKAAGLVEVCKICGLDRTQVVAIGDSLNDVPMLEWAGLGIAMGNAQETVKQAADWVSKRCDEEGVAYALEHKVLREMLPGN